MADDKPEVTENAPETPADLATGQSTDDKPEVTENAPETPADPFAHGKQATLADCRKFAKKTANIPGPQPVMSINDAHRRGQEIIAQAKAQAGAMK